MKLIIDLENCNNPVEGLNHIANALPIYLEKCPDDGNDIHVEFSPNHRLFILYKHQLLTNIKNDLMRWQWHE